MPSAAAVRASRLKGALGAVCLMGALEACWLTASLDASDGGAPAIRQDASAHDAHVVVDGSDVADAADAHLTDGKTSGMPDGSADAARGRDGGDATFPGDAGKDAPVTVDAGSPYRALVLEGGPTVYYRLGESSGTTAANEVVSNGAATYDQLVALRQDGAIFDDPNTAVHFDGDAGCLDMSAVSALSFSGTEPITIELWVRPTLIDDNYRNLFFENESNGSNGSLALFVFRPDGGKATMSFERHASGTATTATVDAPLLDTFSYVAAVYDGTSLLLYVNGSLLATTASAMGITGTVAGNAHAGCGTSGLGFEGTLDEVAVYKKALSVMTISAHYMLGRLGTLDGG